MKRNHRAWLLMFALVIAASSAAVIPGCVPPGQRAALTMEQRNRLDVSEALIAFDATREAILVGHRTGMINNEALVALDTLEKSAREALALAQTKPSTTTLALMNAALDKLEEQYIAHVTGSNSDH